MPIATGAETTFWDASGIVLLCLDQPAASEARRLRDRYPRIVVWWATPVEVASAFERVLRDGHATRAERDRAIDRLSELAATWLEVQPIDRVRALATGLLAKHPLRAADALQLAAALAWTRERPRKRRFVTFDRRLAAAAAAEGFEVA